MLIASVQTAADTAPLTWTQVGVAIAAMTLIAAYLSAPSLIEAWRKAHRKDSNVIDLDSRRKVAQVVPLRKGGTR